MPDQKAFGRLAVLILPLMLLLSACSMVDSDDDKEAESEVEAVNMTIQLTSSAFNNGDPIPARHARRGDNISPALAWSGAPSGTQSFALIVDDPDAPGRTWVHWVVYDLSGGNTDLPEGVTSNDDLPGDAVQGRNDWGESGYGGPQPPSGTHRYFFKLYALDTMLTLSPGATKDALLKAMEGHILAQGQLMGTHTR
jgi:Raf kinase inhibitor-like YbhB/YbcL family protein